MTRDPGGRNPTNDQLTKVSALLGLHDSHLRPWAMGPGNAALLFVVAAITIIYY